MVAPLKRVIVKNPQEAFRNPETIAKEWEGLGYLRPPDLTFAAEEHTRFVQLLNAAGAEVISLPEDSRTGLDSLYTHDPVLVTNAGAVILQMGKSARRGEGPAIADALRSRDIPIYATVAGDATAEAGDMVWLDDRTLLVGRGFRTNASGIEKLSVLLSRIGVTVIPVALPYFKGPADVLHLMSFMSLVDNNLAVVYRPLMPVPLFELLTDRDIEFVDVPDDEYESLGCNVLAVAPRHALITRGNPVTRSRLKAAGCAVSEFDGAEICIPGSGGPTCLTRPLLRG